MAAQNLSGQLAQALRARDDARKRAAPDEQLDAAEAEVERVKSLMSDRLDEIAHELDDLRRQESAQEVRYKTGEYTLAQYRNITADVRRRIASLSRLEESFNGMLQAETEADMRHTSRQAPVSLNVTSPSAAREMVRDEIAGAQDHVAGVKGLAGIPAPKWMLIGSAVLIAVGAVAVLILLIQSAGGAFNLPNLFQRGGDTVSAPPSAVDVIPSTPATPPATVAPASAEFQVPVQLRGAPGIGSLYVELQYDTAAVEVLRVDAAALPANTLFESNHGQGRVVLGLVSSGGLSGDWIVAFVTCKRASGAATSGESAVTISAVQAHRATDLTEVEATASAGRVSLSNLAVVPPAIVFD